MIMTKTQLIYNSANDNSIDGDRLADGSVSNAKLESGIDGAKLQDGSVPPSKLDFSGNPLSSSDVEYNLPATGSEPRTVQARLSDYVNVLDFGAVSGQDCTVAFQAALDYCFKANRRKVLFIPTGAYIISDTLLIDMSDTTQIRTVYVKGELMGSAIRPGVIIHFTQANSVLFDVRLTSFAAESIRFEGLYFSQRVGSSEYRTSTAIRITKTNSAYSRMHRFDDLACTGFDRFLHFFCPFGGPTDNNNYLGPTVVDHCHTYANNTSIHLDNMFLNLFEINECLFHANSNYGILCDNAPLAVSIENTWFEGNQPAAIRSSAFVTRIDLYHVGSESTGVFSGYGFLHPFDDTSGKKNFVLNVLSSNGGGFSFMPQDYRLPKGGVVSSNVPIRVSGTLITIRTPGTVIPTVANDSAFGQTSTHTSFYIPIEVAATSSKSGYRCFKAPTGNTGTSNSTSPNSLPLPDGLRGVLAGCGTSTEHFRNTSESFSAPSDGFIYGVAALKTPSLTGWDSGTQFVINGSPVSMNTAYAQNGMEGLFGVVVPISSGSTLTDVRLKTRGNHEWAGFGNVIFSKNYLSAGSLSSLPAKTSKPETIPDGSSTSFLTNGVGQDPYSVRVRLVFNRGSLGLYEADFYGTLQNGFKTVDVIRNTAGAGILVSTSDGSHVNLYNISVTNTTGNDLSVVCEVEFTS